MATYTPQLKSWKSGLNSQIKAIRTALHNDEGDQLAADMSTLLGDGQHGWNKTHVRSWNAAIQREQKRLISANKLDANDCPIYGLTLNDDKTAVIFGLAKVADNKKEKCPIMVAVATLKAAKLDTPENAAIIVRLIEGMLQA